MIIPARRDCATTCRAGGKKQYTSVPTFGLAAFLGAVVLFFTVFFGLSPGAAAFFGFDTCGDQKNGF